jgi:DNA mismatch repair protein MutS2
MYSGTLRALEFDRIREALASFALTPLGAARLIRLEPRPSRRDVETGLAETTEGVRLIADGPGVPLRAPADLVETLAALGIEGRPLEGLRLIALAEFLASIEHARGGIRKLAAHTFPILTTLVERAARFDQEVADIRKAIDSGGDVVDSASPALRQIRDSLRRSRTRLRTTLESYTRGRDTARYLQDLVVTDRNGRYVLVVKSEHRASIPGIVHGSSASGASLYLEPLSTVDLNNDIVDLQEREAEEVHRILLALTDAFRGRGEDLERTLEVAAELDVIQAKARLAEVCGASAPKLSADGRLELRAARHPLLIEGVVARTRAGDARDRDGRDRHDSERDHDGDGNGDGDGERDRPRARRRTTAPVGVDILLLPPTRVLVITGPNTGGKTVALKAAGLLALMAQAGLHIPAEDGSQVPVFQTIFADIGDEQSIDANLSTFSWHITNIAAMDRALAPPALVLLDEVGAGTDPLEGGALGMAMIDHFRQRGALVIATTHYDPLKSYASTTPEVTAAAFGFDPETFAPTYRLLYGSPGRSLALEMATRLGLPGSIVQAARAFRTEREAQLADHLAKMDTDLHALDRERREVARERQQIADLAAQVRGRDESLKQREDQVTRKLEDTLRERLRDARRDIDAVVETVKKKATEMTEEAARRAAAPRLVNPRLSTGEMGSLRTDARAALEQVAARLRQAEGEQPRDARERSGRGAWAGAGTTGTPQPSDVEMAAGAAGVAGDEARTPQAPAGTSPTGTPHARDREPIAAGMRVIIRPLNLEGIVRAVHDRAADVEVNGKRLRAQLGDLRISDRHAHREAEAREARARVTVHVQAQAPEGSLGDLNVIGCTVPEAIDRTDKFLDQALLAELHQVRVIHGHGTGQLRRALAEFLHDHPLVSKAMPAPANQGGGGVTLVELRE